MFSKNIKTLSLFLVLAAVMIVAVGAVSAADVNVGNGNVTSTPGSNTVTTGDTGTVTSDVTTNLTTTKNVTSEDKVTTVPKGTAISGTVTNESYTNTTLTITVDSKIYLDTKGTDSGVTATIGNVTLTNGNATIPVSAISDDTKLTNGNTYYLKITLPANSAAALKNTDNSHNFTVIKDAFTTYVPFKYSTPTLVLDKNTSTIAYGDAWSFSGTLTGADGKPVYDDTINMTGASDSTGSQTITVKTDVNGKFVINSTMWALKGFTAIPASSTNYTLTFTPTTTTGVNNSTAQLNVTKKTLNIKATLNQTSAFYGSPVTLTVTVTDADGKVLNIDDLGLTFETFNENFVNVAPTTGNTLDVNAKGLYLFDNVDVTSSSTNLLTGQYTVKVSADENTLKNYNIDSSNVGLTIKDLDTTITADPSTVTGDLSAPGSVDLIVNTTNGKEANIDGNGYAMVYDANGYPIYKIDTVTFANGLATVDLTSTMFGNAKGSYTITFFSPTVTGYAVSNTTVKVIIKDVNTIEVNDTLDFIIGTTGNATIINITSSPVQNTTLNVFVNNKSVGTVDVINGTAIFNVGSLKLDAGDYNITFAYAGDKTYNPFNATTKVVVGPNFIGNLTTSNDTIDDVSINSQNKTFTLNLTNATTGKILNYTGAVNYYKDGKLLGTVNMVEGMVTVDATTLKGLTNDENIIVFQVNNNVNSTTATVTINTVAVSSVINADNVSTNNATPITITGTIVNATEGTVNVNLKDAKNKTIATVTGNVAADGTFTVAFGNYANGVYTAEINYTSATGLSKASTKNVTVTVNGTAPTPVVGNVTTNLTINSNFTETYGQGLNLTGKLTDANGNPIVGQHIALNLTNPATGASKIYWVTTDTNGEYQLQINLFVGSYTASASFAGFTTADNKTYYLPSGPANGTITVTNGTEPVDNRTATVLAFSNFTEKYGQALNFTGTLKTTDGTPIVGQKLNMVLSNAAGQSKLYWRTTDTNGEVQLPIELFAGDYTFKCYFEGDSTYQPSNNQTGSITVTA